MDWLREKTPSKGILYVLVKLTTKDSRHLLVDPFILKDKTWTTYFEFYCIMIPPLKKITCPQIGRRDSDY